MLTARISRPILSKDVFELRSSQVRAPQFEQTHISDADNRLVGRRVPFNARLSEVTAENEEAPPVGSLLSVGRVP